MTKQKVGLLLFWIGVIYAFLWGAVIGWVVVAPAYHNLSIDELNQTIWALTGIGTFLWGFGVPLGAALAGIGALLHSDAKGSTIWIFGIGIVLSVFIICSLQMMNHFPPLFGIGGTLMLLAFTGIVWLWMKERLALKGASAIAADLRLVGYVFFLVGVWFVCQIASMRFNILAEEPPTTPPHVIIFFVLGWFFLFLSHYKSHNKRE
jgi:hypothetical protein